MMALLAYGVLGTTQGFMRIKHLLPAKLYPQSLFLENIISKSIFRGEEVTGQASCPILKCRVSSQNCLFS